MLAKVLSASVLGIEGIVVDVEVDIANGLPAFTTVGLPDGSVRESKDRVKAAIKNCGYPFPNKRITVNLAPADLKKEGSAFDLPIALGLLIASNLIDQERIDGYMAIGELSLDGGLRPVTGILPVALAAAERKVRGLIVPKENAQEAALAPNLEVLAVENLPEIVEILNELRRYTPYIETGHSTAAREYPVGFEDIKGQKHVKRAVEVAVAGLHNILMKGPPGSGKTMIARCLPSIMPDWSYRERLETTKIYSVNGRNDDQSPLMLNRPFRAPHHSISDAGLIGGGTIPRPGEVSFAHNGVLFLDELPEFKKHVLEALRQPLEDGCVTIARAQLSLSFPARFMLVAAMNPCPCGFHGDPKNECHCHAGHIQKYRNRISGPLLDRIDMHLDVARIDFADMNEQEDADSSHIIRERVNRAREIQQRRFAEIKDCYVNSRMGAREIKRFCAIDRASTRLLEKSVDQLGLSARAYHRILKLARTMADMEQQENIHLHHVAEAVQYRRDDKAVR